MRIIIGQLLLFNFYDLFQLKFLMVKYSIFFVYLFKEQTVNGSVNHIGSSASM